MTVAILGASGRLGRLVCQGWPEARAFGRSATPSELEGCKTLFDLRGIVNGKGDVFRNEAIAREALAMGRAAGARRVFLPSSAAVYGRMGEGLHEGVAAPVSDYGRSKLDMEQMAAAHAQPATCLRFGNLAGVDAILGGWRPNFMLDQFPDGTTPARSYIGPQTLVQTLKTLSAQDALPDVLNIATPGAIEMGALLDAAALGWRARPAPETAIKCVALDTGLLRLFCAIKPETGSAAHVAAEWKQVFRPE